jgi:hypothetical protein
VLVEKSPPNLIHLRFLQALFPAAAFVVITRHPIPVAYATNKWRWQHSLRTMVRHWVVAHEIYRRDRPRIAKLLEVRFEDLVRDADAVLAEVFGFLGLPPVPAALEVRPEANDHYLERWRAEGRSLRGRVEHRLIRRELGGRVRELGYSLDDADLNRRV